jgi:hypothetical protein
MDYDGRFIMQKTMVSTNRPVDWSLLRSTSGCLLPTGRKNYHRIIHKNNPHFNRNKFQFEFQNGEVLRLRLNESLKVL